MTAQQLKNAILQEAIEGRLVPQDPNDEPASALLQRIREEKARLVKEGKLKKKDLEEKPISEDEIPFEIPEGWEWVRLIALSKLIHYGYTASAASQGNSKLLRITDIQDDKVSWTTVPFCTIKDSELEKYQLHNRDILIARTGGTIGKTYIVRELNDVAVFASYLIRSVPLENVYEEYLKLFMGSPCYWSQLIDAASGTGQPNVNGQSLSNLIVPLPPLAEQRRIVAKIEELLPKVEEYGKAQEKLNKLNEELPERLKKSILQEAIEGRLVPQDPNDEPASTLLNRIREEKKQLVKAGKLKKKDLEEKPISEDEIPFEIPESWEWVRVSDISESFIGLTYKPSDVSNKGWVVLRSSNIQDGNLDFSDIVRVNVDVPEKLHVRENDIIICARNGSKKLVGKSALVKEIKESMTFGAFMALCRTPFYSYMSMYLLSPLFFDQLRKESDTTTINQLTQKNFNKYIVPLPPLAEQHRIVAKIEELLAKIDGLKK